MEGIVIDIWEKSNFLGSIGSQKDAKNAFFLHRGQNMPPAICRVKEGLKKSLFSPLKLIYMKKIYGLELLEINFQTIKK